MTGGFTGFGAPIIYKQENINNDDSIFIPKGFLHNQEAYGVHYQDASRIVYGAGLRILYQR